ncbi:MAG TPA: hypothetical protein VJ417_16755 [Candidatus Glassbacteria bacterium]|nr:hypothetical protein [Candidatus Glassbacteria bacterium]
MHKSKKISRQRFIGTALALPLAVSTAAGQGKAAEGNVGFRLLDHPRHKRDFGDRRSRWVVFLAHCLANMNARMHLCANVFPACVKPVIQLCLEREVGIVQMPCPELMVVGLGRDRDEPEVEYLRQALEQPIAVERIRKLAEQVVFQMQEYRFQGFRMIAVVGSDGSPSCGVDQTAWPDPARRFAEGQGVFVRELKDLMKQAGIDLPFKGLEDDKADATVAWLAEQIGKAPG